MNRLKELRKSRGLTQTDVAKYIGISQNNYSYWENGKVKIDTGSMQKLADFFGVTVDYILGNDTIPPYKNIYPLTPYIHLPIFGEIHAGTPINTDQGETGEWDFADVEYGDGKHFMLRVSGDSMTPTIPDGSIAIIRQQDYADKGQVVAFALNGDEATLKRYYPQSNGNILLRGDNPEAESYVVTPEQLKNGEAHIIGVVRSYKVNM